MLSLCVSPTMGKAYCIGSEEVFGRVYTYTYTCNYTNAQAHLSMTGATSFSVRVTSQLSGLDVCIRSSASWSQQ